MKAKSEIVAKAFNALKVGALYEAKNVITEKYPFELMEQKGRNYREEEKIRIFIRDGFIDRYSGERLVFPPVLRIMSVAMPEEFPFHKNWKMSECHLAYWHLLPTVDHIVPVSRGGADEESNWVCTSQLRNGAKSNWLLEELGWELYEPGNMDDWDGLVACFMEYVLDNPEILTNGYIRTWYNVSKRVVGIHREGLSK